jgi:hypothetical protein
LARIVALRIHSAGTRKFDEVRQTLVWSCADPSGNGIPLELAFAPGNEGAIRCLENLDPAALPGAVVVGRLERSGHGLVLIPFAVYPPFPPGIQLGFAKASASASAAIGTGDREAVDTTVDHANPEEGEGAGDGMACHPDLKRVLDQVDAVLVAIAEGGTAGGGRKAIESLVPLVGQLRGLGLESLAVCLERISSERTQGAGLLRGAHISAVLRGLGCGCKTGTLLGDGL